ncbi:MAG: hypothetical protein KJ864_08020, partial [Candidatus Omnitrophica bacterium]|nr:hypothetical protein [Candidatus Omnitrophota bacterium]
MNHFAISAAVTAVATLLLAFFVISRNTKSYLYRVFALYSFSITLWSACVAVHGFAREELLALVAAHLLHIGASLIPVTFIHFVFVFIDHGEISGARKKVLQGLYAIALFFIVVSFFPAFVSTVAPRYGIPFLMYPGNLLYHLSVFYFCTCVAYGLYKMFMEYVYSKGIRHNQMKYLFWSSLFGYIGGLSNYLIIYGINIFPLNPYGTYAVTIYVIITAYAITRYHLLDIRIAISRTVTFLLIYMPILSIPFFMGYWINRLWKGGIGNIGWFFAILLEAILAPSGLYFYLKLQKKIERRLKAKKLEYLKTMEDFLEEVKHIRGLNDLVDLVVAETKRIMDVEKAWVYLVNSKWTEQITNPENKFEKEIPGALINHLR